MAYCVQALVGLAEALLDHVPDFHCAQAILLPQKMALIPLTDELAVEIGTGNEIDGFQKLSVPVLEWAKRISLSAPVAYIEAEFFGGIGEQISVVWFRGAAVMAPNHSHRAINEALRHLGVQTSGAHDEFDALGLGRHRDTHNWVA